MLGSASHMLLLQVSHLKIPIHYIVYGKITPFTDQYASLLCNLFLCVLGRTDDKVWMCLQGDCTQRVQAAGVFFVVENLQHYTASRNFQKYTSPAQ